MTDKEQLARLRQQMDGLLQKQGLLKGEILQLQRELARFQLQSSEEEPAETPEPSPMQAPPPPTVRPAEPSSEIFQGKPAAPFDWEQYIGGNLINKIGIAVLLLGLGLFVKYAIDKGLFPPAVRVMAGYVAGLALVGTAFYLRKKYEAYSAVLFSGGMATLYFTTYIGCTFFQPLVIGVLPAFWLMSFFTACTIIVAGWYDLQIIGLLGLVGAYAVPFLVNTGSENYALFFSYVTLINVGVLVLAARRDWQAMTHTACLLSWLILVVALIKNHVQLHDSPIALAFSIVTMLLFYSAILAWHWRRQTPLGAGAYTVLVIQALIFYSVIMTLGGGGLGYASPGLKTLLCATPHFLAAYAVQQRFEDKRSFIFFATLGIIFVTIAIPIEFGSRAIVLLWMAEALALFYFGRKLQSTVLVTLTYLLLIILGAVLIFHWGDTYYSYEVKPFPPLWNMEFLTNLLLVAGTVALHFIHRHFPPPTGIPPIGVVIKCLPVALGYLAGFHEISHVFELEAAHPSGAFGQADAVLIFRNLWLFNYTFGALALAAWLKARRWKSANLEVFLTITGLLGILLFLATHLEALNDLRSLFITDKTHATPWFILIRYACYGMLGWLYYHLHHILRNNEELQSWRPQVPLLLHLLLLVLLTTELATVWLLLLGTPDSPLPYREGFSILWGMYSFLLIGLGFRKKSQTLRVAGMALFGVTLVKIFFFDLENLPILSRTVLFLVLGALLLGASYLYQRFRERM